MRSDQRKAVELVRQVWEAWRGLEESGFPAGLGAGRFLRVAGKAEAAVRRIAWADLDDPGPRIVAGEIAGLRSLLMAGTQGRTSATAALQAARSALWGLYGAELDGGGVDRIAALAAQPAIETDFTSSDDVTGVIHGEARLASAADVRFQLAERLKAGRPVRSPMTPDQLDSTLRARDKYHRTDEALLWECQLASCRGFDAGEETEMLVTEATAAYRYLAQLDNLFGPDDVARAEQRGDAVLSGLRRG